MRVEFEEELRKTPLPFHWRELLIAKADETGGSSVYIRGFSDRPYFKGAFGGSALNSLVKITGYNSKQLNEIADGDARAHREEPPRAQRARDHRRAVRAHPQEEMVIKIRRERLAAHDLTVVDLTAQVRRMLGVDIPWTMLIDGDQERVQLSYADAKNISYADIAELVVRNPAGEQVRLGDLIDIQSREVSRTITRENQKYTTHVNWEYLGTDQMRQKFIKDVLAGIQLPYGYKAEEARQEFLTEEEEEEIGLALWLSVAFIFIVLAAMMESISLPLLILLSIPMALVGVFVIFWLTHSVFDSSARIGLVLLFGVAVNNAILLISRYRVEAKLILKSRLGSRPGADHLAVSAAAPRRGRERPVGASQGGTGGTAQAGGGARLARPLPVDPARQRNHDRRLDPAPRPHERDRRQGHLGEPLARERRRRHVEHDSHPVDHADHLHELHPPGLADAHLRRVGEAQDVASHTRPAACSRSRLSALRDTRHS